MVDFDALTAAVRNGRLRVATDVFPEEPLPPGHPIRDLENTVLSAHRAGGMAEAFIEIGDMVLSDLELLLRGLPPVSCKVAQPETVRPVSRETCSKELGERSGVWAYRRMGELQRGFRASIRCRLGPSADQPEKKHACEQ